MEAERWHDVEKLYHEASARDPTARGVFLKEATEDEQLAREVASLLAEEAAADRFLESGWQRENRSARILCSTFWPRVEWARCTGCETRAWNGWSP